MSKTATTGGQGTISERRLWKLARSGEEPRPGRHKSSLPSRGNPARCLPRKITRTDVWQFLQSTDVERSTRKRNEMPDEEPVGGGGGGFPGMVYSLLAIVHYSMNEVPE